MASAALWAIPGILLGVFGSIAVALVNRKPTALELEGDAFEQLQSLSNLYRADLAEARLQRAEALKIEQALRLDLSKAHEEIKSLRDELRQARIEILELRALVRQGASGPDNTQQ